MFPDPAVLAKAKIPVAALAAQETETIQLDSHAQLDLMHTLPMTFGRGSMLLRQDSGHGVHNSYTCGQTCAILPGDSVPFVNPCCAVFPTSYLAAISSFSLALAEDRIGRTVPLAVSASGGCRK